MVGYVKTYQRCGSITENAAELHAACTVNDRTSQRRAHDDQRTAFRAEFVPSSKLGVDIFIIIE